MNLNLPAEGMKLLQKFLLPPQPTPFVPKPKGALRVVTFNAHSASEPQALARLFKSNANLALADIFLFQEIDQLDRERISRVTKIARILKCQYKYIPARKLQMSKGTHGIAIVSRLPLKLTETIILPYFELPLRHRPRVALKIQMEIAGKNFCVYNLHLDTTLNHRERVAQLSTVINDIETNHPASPIILAGDFNTIPMFLLGRAIPIFYSNQKKKFQSYLKRIGFETTCQAAGYTLNKGFVRFQLDGIYTRNALVIQCAVERSIKLSDHFPLWADIKI